MKRFLVALVASMFLASAAYAGEAMKDEKKAAEKSEKKEGKSKSDAKSKSKSDEKMKDEKKTK
jgi:hypothetical protein